MTRARKLIFGEIDGGSNCVQFAYGCACYTLSSLVKDPFQVTFIKDTLPKVINLAQIFRKAHVADALLKSARENTQTSPPTK